MNRSRRSPFTVAWAIAFALTALSAAQASDNGAAHANLGKDRLAIQGYDPVAYFATGRPARGRAGLTAEHAGAVYRFANEQNRKRFLESPQEHVPQYGGWCATAMAYDKKVKVDPTNFKITDGRLLLFYKSLLHDARDDWNKDEPALTRRADENWKRITSE